VAESRVLSTSGEGGIVITAERPSAPAENPEGPKRWLIRCALYGLTAFYVLPVIMFGTFATMLFADGKWVGASVCAVACVVYAVVGWKRLHGKLTYLKPPLILELRRRLDR
jgi:hypothetical protein